MMEIQKMRAVAGLLIPLIDAAPTFSKRNAEIACRYLRGESCGELAKDYGLSVGRIAQVVWRSIKVAQEHRDMTLLVSEAVGDEPITNYTLSARAVNCLQNAGITTRSQLSEIWSARGRKFFMKMPNLGAKSVNEIVKVFDLPTPDVIRRVVTRGEYDRALMIVSAFREQNRPEP